MRRAQPSDAVKNREDRPCRAQAGVRLPRIDPMKFTRWWGLAALLLVVGAALWWWTHRDADSGVGYKTAPLERGALLAAVSSSGTVNPVSQVSIGSQVSGQIKEMRVDFNSEVKQGQLIARIDPQTFEYKVNQAAADLESARALVLNAQANVGAVQASVSRARLDADNALRDQNRKQELLARQFISTADFDTARNVAATLGEALKVSLAQLEVARAQVVAAQATVRQRDAALAQARVDLQRTEIRSPVDGVVIKRSVDVGQTVAASLQAPELFIIARNLSDMQVEAAVDEADIARVQLDQKVSFTIDAFAGRTFEGRVNQIRKAAISAQNVVTYTVIVRFANPGALLLPGMTANVRIVTEVRGDVLKVPNAALRVRIAGLEPAADASKAASAASATPEAAAKASGGPPSGAAAASANAGRGARNASRGRIHLLGADGKPRAFNVRLGVTDGLMTELLPIGNSADAALLQAGAEVIVGVTNPNAPAVGAPRGASGGPGASRAPF
jgi:HlyD family secretion protein